MKKLFVVTYKKECNPYIHHYQNSNRNIGTRIFANREEAKSFADNVEVLSIRNEVGQRISL